MQDESRFSRRAIDRSILRLALPSIASNLTVPLLGLCDTGVTGHLGHPRYVAAIAVGGTMVSVLLWLFGFLRMGTTGMTAQAFGADVRSLCRLLFTRSLLLALAAGFLLIAFREPLGAGLQRLIGADAATAPLALRYFRTVTWGVPGLLGSMAVAGWLLGMQNSVRPMVIAIGANVVNIVASVVFVFPCGMGFEGTALGTLTANWCSFALALWLVRGFCGGRLPLAPLRQALSPGGLGRFFRVNTDLFFRSFAITAVSLGVTAVGARMGDTAMAANAVVMQMFLLFSYFADGIAFAAEALSGRAAGAGEPAALRRTVSRLLLWCGIVACSFTLAYALGYGAFSRFLVPHAQVLAAIESLRLWIILLPVCSIAAFIFDGFYIGLTATRPMLVATAVASVAFFIVAVVPGECEAARLWTGFEVYLALRGLMLAAWFPRLIKVKIS